MLRKIIRVIFTALAFKLGKITTYLVVERNFAAASALIRNSGAMENQGAVRLAIVQLIEKQHAIIFIFYRRYIKFNECGGDNRNHIIKAHNAETTVIQFKNGSARFYICMVWLWGLERNVIVKTVNGQNNTDIGAVLTFIELNAAIGVVKIAYVVLIDMIKTETSHKNYTSDRKKAQYG